MGPSRKKLPGALAPLDADDEAALVRRAEELRRRARPLLEGEDDFDRVKFAKRLLSLLAPSDVRVVVFASNFDLKVDIGRAHERGPGQRWASVAIPPDASREHIALAIAEIAGVARLPFVLDWLSRVA
jgi:hypothetical protein